MNRLVHKYTDTYKSARPVIDEFLINYGSSIEGIVIQKNWRYKSNFLRRYI